MASKRRAARTGGIAAAPAAAPAAAVDATGAVSGDEDDAEAQVGQRRGRADPNESPADARARASARTTDAGSVVVNPRDTSDPITWAIDDDRPYNGKFTDYKVQGVTGFNYNGATVMIPALEFGADWMEDDITFAKLNANQKSCLYLYGDVTFDGKKYCIKTRFDEYNMTQSATYIQTWLSPDSPVGTRREPDGEREGLLEEEEEDDEDEDEDEDKDDDDGDDGATAAGVAVVFDKVLTRF